MGIVNVTPDSFSGDGVAADVAAAARVAREHELNGADIVDIGGESTRPGAEPVPLEDELSRVIPAIKAVRDSVSIPISVDTTKAEVAEQALQAGATVVNDVSGLEADPRMMEVVACLADGVVIMHSRKRRTCDDVMLDVLQFLRESLRNASSSGVRREGIVVDPGFGFSKKPEENLAMLRRLAEMKVLGLPILVGTSRKSTIGKVLCAEADDRLEGTAATIAVAIANGADIIRVHDVRPCARVARMTDAIVRGWRPDSAKAHA